MNEMILYNLFKIANDEQIERRKLSEENTAAIKERFSNKSIVLEEKRDEEQIKTDKLTQKHYLLYFHKSTFFCILDILGCVPTVKIRNNCRIRRVNLGNKKMSRKIAVKIILKSLILRNMNEWVAKI